MKVQHDVYLTDDDRADQRLLVGEVVGELGPAYRCRLAQRVHIQRREALAQDEFGGDLQDPITRCPALGRQTPLVLQLGLDHSVRLSRRLTRLWDVYPIRSVRVSLSS